MKWPKLILRVAPAAFALGAGFFLMPAGRAQPAPPAAGERFLFIFDTSADMKPRLPAVQAEVNELLATSLGGRLRTGDSLGVWTFDRDLRAGQFPLQYWRPEDAVTMAASINQFIRKQPYANATRFDALQPQLNQVIQNSARLTVLIFCDGENELKWTPYAAGINQIFQQRLAEQKRTRQPFVLVFRAQLGQYAGCAVNFPPGMVSVPEFPPLPVPPALVKMPPPAPAVKPPIGPPLIMVGTKVETNWPPAPAPPLTNRAPVTPRSVAPALPTNLVAPKTPSEPPPPNSAPMTPPNLTPVVPTIILPAAPAKSVVPPLPANPAPTVQTNTLPAPPANWFAPTNSGPATPTNLAPISPSNSMTSTNQAAPTPENSNPARKLALGIGGVLLIAAGGLAALAVFRGRRTDHGSLITRSMRKD